MIRPCFTLEQFSNYIKTRMSYITVFNSNYIIDCDTQYLLSLVPDGLYTENEVIKYIYDNRLFEELEKFLSKR